MTGHAAGDGVDRVLDVDAAFLEHVGELTDVVLRLRDGRVARLSRRYRVCASSATRPLRKRARKAARA